MQIQDMTITDLLKIRATQNADDIAFRFLGNGEIDGSIIEWTFSELYRQSAGVAAELVRQGLSGESVLLVFPPGLDFVKAFFGCLLARARGVPVPLPNPRSENPLGKMLSTAKACGATTVLTNQEMAELAASLGDLPIDFQAVTDKLVDGWEGPRPEMSEIAYLQFTSGSTGHPKGVSVSHSNLVSNMRVMGEMLRVKATSPAMVWAPHYHDLCLAGHVLGPVYHGFESILMSPMEFLIKPVRWLRAMSYYKVVNSAAPNFGYDYSVRRIKPEECEGLDLSHWAIAGNGGEPVHKHTMDAFVEKFGPYGFKRENFMPCYGMAESVLFVAGLKSMSEAPKVLSLSANDLEDHRVKILTDGGTSERSIFAISCGSPASAHRVIAVDPDTMMPSSPGRVGELWACGPSVPSGYWGLPKESAETFDGRLADSNEGPFLRTGDLGFVVDEEVYIIGRLKDLIIIAGRNHYPSDVEVTVQQSGAPVRLGACVAVSVPVKGNEELVVIAELDERKLPEGVALEDVREKDVSLESLKEFWATAARTVQGSISKVHGIAVRSVVFVEPRSLEKTSSGKPRRRYYQKQFLDGKLAVLREVQLVV